MISVFSRINRSSLTRLDLKAAFNSVDRAVPWRYLSLNGVPDKFISFYQSLCSMYLTFNHPTQTVQCVQNAIHSYHILLGISRIPETLFAYIQYAHYEVVSLTPKALSYVHPVAVKRLFITKCSIYWRVFWSREPATGHGYRHSIMWCDEPLRISPAKRNG